MSNWIDAITSPLKAASDGIKGLVEVRDTIKFGEAVSKLYADIFAAQQGATAALARETSMLEEIGGLKKRVGELEAWDAEKQRYELIALAPGMVAYAVKDGVRGTEPPHHICANCYNAGKKSFLQQLSNGPAVFAYRCNTCKEELTVTNPSAPRQRTAITNPGYGGGGPDGWMGR